MKYLLTGLLAGLLVGPALAQDTPPAADPALPDIAPREIEIRGQLEVSFPSLRRQPLVGFNPPPRIPTVDAGRKPYMADYKQRSGDLPTNPLGKPVPPPVNSVEGLQPILAEFELAAGRYLSRRAVARGELLLDESNGVYGSLVYDGSNGHDPYPDTAGTNAGYNVVAFLAGVQTARADLAAGAELDAFWQEYGLFGVRNGIAGTMPTPTRRGRDLGLSAWLRTLGEAPVYTDARLRYGASRVSTELFEDVGVPDAARALRNPARTERRLDLDVDLALPFGLQRLRGDARASAAWLGTEPIAPDGDAETTPDNTVLALAVGGGAEFRYRGVFDVFLGGRFLTFDAPPQPTSDAEDAGSAYLVPVFQVRTFPIDGLLVYAQNQPGIDHTSLSDLYRENPYLIDAAALQPTVRTIDAEGGISVYVGRFRIKGQAGYQRSPNWLFFEQPLGDIVRALPYRQGLTLARYDKVNILHVGGATSVIFPFGLQGSFSTSVRRGRLRADDAPIPYFSPIVSELMLAYRFPDRRAKVQVTGTYERARYWNRTSERRIGDFFDVDVEGSYQVTEQAGVLLRVQNASADRLEYWDRYPRAPLIVEAGVRLVW